jgi:protein-S-isoprenylcysteine O-methyltransferase Ste14
MDQFLRIFLPVFLLLFFVAALGGRSYLVWKRTGINPYKLGRTESAHDLVGLLFRFVSLLVLFTVIVFSSSPSLYAYLGPITWLEDFYVRCAGTAILLAALVWVAAAQAQMGASWRIGIDSEHETELVSKGLFAISRNPIFFGMRTLLFGLFLVIPNALTLLAFGLGDALMQIQVRLEEEHMSKLHSEEFEEYRRSVRRWI